MGCYPLLNERKTKKALLKNSANLRAIHDMYWEEYDYKIIFPDKTVIKKKFKYHVSQVMEKFNINSSNELIVLFQRLYGPLRNCQFCGEDVYEVPLRNGINVQDCRHVGICCKCNKPATGLNKNGYCCVPSKDQIFMGRLGFILHLIQYDEEEIREYNINDEELKFIINFIEEKLNIFKKLSEEDSHGGEISSDNPRRIHLR